MAYAVYSNLNEDPAEWLERQFEFEYCAECRGDACHHTAFPFMGNWFARCDFPPAEDDAATPHPVIVAYREETGTPCSSD